MSVGGYYARFLFTKGGLGAYMRVIEGEGFRVIKDLGRALATLMEKKVETKGEHVMETEAKQGLCKMVGTLS